MFWLAIGAIVLAAGGVVWFSVQRWSERQAAEEDRLAAFLVATAGKAKAAESSPAPAAPAAPASAQADGLALQKLLYEAAHKAGEAGEPALAIQLYARLLARYPASAFAGQARAAIEAERKKLAKA